jgi:hypothetical protein
MKAASSKLSLRSWLHHKNLLSFELRKILILASDKAVCAVKCCQTLPSFVFDQGRTLLNLDPCETQAHQVA